MFRHKKLKKPKIKKYLNNRHQLRIFFWAIFASLKEIIDYFETNSLTLVFDFKYSILCFSNLKFKAIFLIIFI
jgi:hypothetical protein